LSSKLGIELGAGRNLPNRFLERLMMYHEEHEAAVAAFIRNNGITRCPTACALPTQASPGPADRTALQRYAALRNQTRKRQLGARDRSFWTAKVLAGSGE
jgi:hypothetical protein